MRWVVGRNRRVSGGSPPPSYDADALTLFAAMATDPGTTRKDLYNDLIVGLKADSIWNSLDLLYIFAAHEWQTALLNIRQPGTYTCSEVNSPVFTIDRGYSGGGTARVSTGFNPATAPTPKFVQDSGHVGAYINSTVTDTGSNLMIIGLANNSVNNTYIRPRTVTNQIDGPVNQNSGSSFFATVPSRTGYFVTTRTASTTTTGYRNGTQVGVASASPSGSPASQVHEFLRHGTSYNGNDRVAAGHVGSGLTGTQVSDLNTRLSTFLTAIGAN